MVCTSSQNLPRSIEVVWTPWISTTNKSSCTMGNDRIPSQSAEQTLKFKIVRLAKTPQSASTKVTRSAQHFDCKDHSEAKYDSSPPGLNNQSDESPHN